MNPAGIRIHLFLFVVSISLIFNCGACKSNQKTRKNLTLSGISDSISAIESSELYKPVNFMMVLPKNPLPHEKFRILIVGNKQIAKAQISVTSQDGKIKSEGSKTGNNLPFWRIDDFQGGNAGKYFVTVTEDKKIISNLEFTIASSEVASRSGVVWTSTQGWNNNMEVLYSAWINALFYDCDEQSSWTALNKVTEDKNKNFLYNYLSLGEDEPDRKNSLVMQPDCADNPFFLRAYFAWKLGLPFGYHLCDRGYLGRNPRAGQWITNETSVSGSNPVASFNNFLRKLEDGVQSGTARTSLDDENSDYYPVPLEKEALRPGTVFADPYGHTLILTGYVPQKLDSPGLLLAVDAQPDGTVAIKRFWKGNFLFNTSEVIGEPGFKAFRPISLQKGTPVLIKNKDLTLSAGFVPYSLQQRKMGSETFYQSMERLINPMPLDPESALLDRIQALYEQLRVRVTSVANGEAYFKSHPGSVIPMPSSAAGIFQAGGQWEDFSTPNRDLRLLIAMDEVLSFPDLVTQTQANFKLSGHLSPEQLKEKLKSILDKKVSDLSISYNGSDGSIQTLSVGEILKREDAFEMAYNPNDGIEIRWGAPENSNEMLRCRRHAPLYQVEKMRGVRMWFHKRLHPPT
jgi:hypothetical protein